MVVDLNISPANRRLRIATHGRGIFERDLVSMPLSNEEPTIALNLPNPATTWLQLEIALTSKVNPCQIELLSLRGQTLVQLQKAPLPAGLNQLQWKVDPKLPKGQCYIRLKMNGQVTTQALQLQ